MMTVYAAKWCPHCQKTVAFLKSRNIPFHYVEIEEAPEDVVRKVDEVNGGEWVVPTIEFNGSWRPGKAFNEKELIQDLNRMGLELK